MNHNKIGYRLNVAFIKKYVIRFSARVALSVLAGWISARILRNVLSFSNGVSHGLVPDSCAVVSLGLVSPGAATDGVTLFFPLKN